MKSRKSPRRSEYDYRSAGGYFVTICCKDRQHYFGEIENEIIILNDIGNIINNFIQSIPDHFPHVEIHKHIVMPNHIHILLMISEIYDLRRDDPLGRPLEKENNDSYLITTAQDLRTTQCIVPTAGNHGKHQPKPGISPKSGSLSVIIGSFKSICTRTINLKSTEGIITIPFDDVFARQPRYHDRIIRNQLEYDRINHYIQTNGENRQNDTFNL